MKPVSVLLALLTLGVALSAVSWLTKPGPEVPEIEADTPAVAKETEENPFEVDESGPVPKAVVDDSTHEFGSMEFGQAKHYTFVIRNEGDAPLRLKVGPVQCKCTVAELDIDTVPPGESAEIAMSWRPTEIAAEFHQKADIWTNDPENRKLELHVKGAVEQLAIVIPSGDWPLNRIAEDEVRKFTGLIMSRHLDEFNILDYETTTDLLTVEFEPLNDEELIENNVKCGYKVIGHLKGEMPIGQFKASLTLMTDMNGSQDFDIKLVGLRLGPFSILGKNWVGGQMLVKMGDIKRAEGKTVKLSMFVTREDEPALFEVVSSDPPFLNLTFEKDESFDVPTREKHWMIFTVPPDSPIGSWTSERTGTIVVKTNRETAPQFEINAELTVDE